MSKVLRKATENSLRQMLRFFVQGLIILAPIGITAYALYWLFEQVDGILRPYVNVPGLGFAIIIIFVILAFLTWLVVVLDKNSKAGQANALAFEDLPKPGRTVWVMWIALIVVMIGFYIFFNGH